ncbi:MAG: hypothetical protein AAFR51_05490 [Pseudomonadota bacterium]
MDFARLCIISICLALLLTLSGCVHKTYQHYSEPASDAAFETARSSPIGITFTSEMRNNSNIYAERLFRVRDTWCVDFESPCQPAAAFEEVRYSLPKGYRGYRLPSDPTEQAMLVAFAPALLPAAVSNLADVIPEKSRRLPLDARVFGRTEQRGGHVRLAWSTDNKTLRTNWFSCAPDETSVSQVDFETDAEAAALIWENRHMLAAACLKLSARLFLFSESPDPAEHAPDKALELWMLGALRERWEHLQCEYFASRYVPYRFEGEERQIEPLGSDVRRVYPASFTWQTGLSRIDFERFYGGKSEKFLDLYYELMNSEATYDYEPPIATICERSGGEANEELVDSRRAYLTLFHPLSQDADVLLLGSSTWAWDETERTWTTGSDPSFSKGDQL